MARAPETTPRRDTAPDDVDRPGPRGRAAALARGRAREAAPVGVLVALVLAVAVYQPSFLSVGSLRILAEEAVPLLLLALGQSIVILLGSVDLSTGALASLAALLLALWLPVLGPGAVVLVVVLGAMAGAFQGFVHAKAQVPSFVVTLGGLGLWSGIALAVSGASNIRVAEGFEAVSWLVDRVGPFPVVVLFALVVLGLLAAAVRWLPFGKSLYAIGVAEPVALLSGVRVTRVKVLAFATSGAFAALTAIVLVARLRSASPTLADALLLPSIAAVVVGGSAITGGVGGVGRTLVGALILSLLRVGLSIVGVEPAYQQVVYGLLVIVAVALTIDRTKLAIVK